MFSNCGHIVLYILKTSSFLIYIYIHGLTELSMNFLFLMTNSVACISLVIFPVEILSRFLTHQKSPCTNFCKMLLVTSSNSTLSGRTVPLILSRYQSSKFASNKFHTAICSSYSATSTVLSYLVFFPSLFLSVVCQ